ncbi:MAG: hypothetical protein OXD36_18115 [Rhodobacter sp.]|nr:hypothetical protein [Rhodobacter sp.]
MTYCKSEKDSRPKTIEVSSYTVGPYKRRPPKPKPGSMEEIVQRFGGRVSPKDEPKGGMIKDLLGKDFVDRHRQNADRP